MPTKGKSTSPYVYAMRQNAANQNASANAQRSANLKGTASAGTTSGTGAATTTANTPNMNSFIFASAPSSDYSNMFNNYSNNITSSYKNRVATETALKDDYLKGLLQTRDTGLANLKKDYDVQRGRMGEEYGNSQADTNAGYDTSARQNYINYMQAQKNLPDQLNALGIRGGASESSLIRLGANYGTNVAANESARQTALRDLERQYKDQLFNAEQNYNKAVASINDTYSNDTRSYMDTFNRLMSQLEAEKGEKLLTAQQTALENDYKARKEAESKDLEQFANTIGKAFKTADEYRSLIKALRASKDPNKNAKINLARAAMNDLAEKEAEEAAARASSRSSGGYSRSYGGGGGYYNSGSNSGYDDDTESAPDNSAAIAAVNAAQQRGASMTDYYKNQANTTKKKDDTWKKYGTPNSAGRWVG